MDPESLLKLTKIILALKAKVKCPICLDFVENTVELGCAHQFCSSCLHQLRLQNLPLCPLCKVFINKRTAVYKDQFADDLTKFVDRTCQLIRENYAHEVDELNTNEGKLQQVIETAPQDVCRLPTSSAIPKLTQFKKPNEDAFATLFGQPKRCYSNRKRKIEQKEKPKVLHFIDSDNRTKIINWLNDNQEKLDTLTQTPSCMAFSDDEADFELPSISQVPSYRKQKPGSRLRSQSLTMKKNLNEPLLKRFHSLTQGLNEDDYDIEEVHSEKLVKQVERKVLQDLLEDECLANMEHLAQQSKDRSKKEKVAPKKQGKSLNKNKSSNIPNSGSTSGWDRIKDVKKSIKKATKEPKKLNISLQETVNTKKSPKGNTKESQVEKLPIKTKKQSKDCSKESLVETATKMKKSRKPSTAVDSKENEDYHKRVDNTVDIPSDQASHNFNLSTVENYFEKHIGQVKVTPDKNTSDMEIDIVNKSTKPLKDLNVQNRKSNSKKNTSAKDNGFDEEIYLAPTQMTPQSANQNNKLCYIAPVPKEFNDTNNIAVRLTDNLLCCISSASNLKHELSHSLVECFTNLKTYTDKILAKREEKREQEMQTSQIKAVPRRTTAAQTDTLHFPCKATQTRLSPVKINSVKSIQTSQKILQNAKVQTDIVDCVDQEVQATEHLSTRGITKERSVEKVIPHSIEYSLSPPDTLNKSLNNKNITKICKQTKSSNQTYSMEQPEDEKKAISTKMSRNSSVNNQEQQISVDSSKGSTNKTNISQDSLLICSVEPTASNVSNRKINRKLVYGETQSRSFKRIRKPATDSESDEDGKPSKRKFIRDDLTVEFVDTERESKEDTQTKAGLSPESEQMDYDKYLLEVMAKYGTPPPEKKSENRENNSVNNKKQNTQETTGSQRKKSPRPRIESQKSQKDSGDHVFTAHVAFEQNLNKFDKDIFDFEHTAKSHSSEYDLVENTPLISPRPKIPRLQPSNKKKETKKGFMIEPLLILSKGSASSSGTSKKKEPLVEERLSHLTQKELSTLNKNIENIPSQTEKCTGDVADILEDLRNDEDFFKSNMESDEKEQEIINLLKQQTKHSDELGSNVNMVDLPDDVPNSKDNDANEEALNITQENINEVMENLNGFGDDDAIDAELEKISFTAEQIKLNASKKNQVQILQNIKLKSQDRPVAESELNDIIESSDVSDEEIVETTPQKKKSSSKDRSPGNLEELENNSLGISTLELCLPPPPGFGDEVFSPIPDDARESPLNDMDCQPLGVNKSSLTPDSLSDFIVTPNTLMHKKEAMASQNENTQHSITFKPTFLTPNRPAKGNGNVIHSTPRVSQLSACDPVDRFSPITKSTIKFSQTKYTPLVSMSKLSTKKASLMTSTPNQKSILNYVKASQDSPTVSQQKPKPCIMWSRIVNKDLIIFTQMEHKKLVTTATSFSSEVTHLVVLVDEKGRIVSHTAKVLIAIGAGIWVVRYEWAQDCLRLNRIVPEEPYEALDTTGVPGPQISRLTRDAKPLFGGFRFYCADPLLTIPKRVLENILQLSGGEIAGELDDLLREDGKVNIILTESSASEETEQFETLLHTYKAVTIDVEWLTKCIGQYKLVSFRAFLVSGDDSNICDLGYPPTLVESVPFTLTEAL